MQLTLPKTTLQLMLGAMIMTAIAMGCSDSSTKETSKDSAAVKDSGMATDTMRMDTAKTRPAVPPPDEPK